MFVLEFGRVSFQYLSRWCFFSLVKTFAPDTCHVGELLFAGAPLKKMEDLPSYPPIQSGIYVSSQNTCPGVSTDVNHPEKN